MLLHMGDSLYMKPESLLHSYRQTWEFDDSMELISATIANICSVSINTCCGPSLEQ